MFDKKLGIIKIINYAKVITLGLIIILLFLKSTLNPMYNDYTYSQMAFLKINFIYWLFSAMFVTWIILFVNLENFGRYADLVAIGIYGVFISFFIFYGFDVTDTGFSLSKQWAMFNGMWKENFDFLAGSNLIGGLWLKIPGKPLLIWARTGFVIIQILTIFVSFKLIKLYFKPKEIFPAFVPISLLLSVWHLYFTINYDNLPYLLFITSLYFLLKSLKHGNSNKLNLYISGILVMAAAYCRITYYSAFLFPPFLMILDSGIKKEKINWNNIAYFAYGILISAGFIALFMTITGGLSNYISHFMGILIELTSKKDPSGFYAHDHSIYARSYMYVGYWINISSSVLKYFTLIYVTELILFKARLVKLLKYPIFLLSYGAFYYLIFEMNYENQFFRDVSLNLISFFISIYIFLLVSNRRKEIKEKIIPVISAVGLVFFSFIGSDLGIRAAFHTGSCLLLFSIPVILIKKSEFKYRKIFFKTGFVYLFVIISFTFASIYKKDNLYREISFQFLQEEFETPMLYGIKSSERRTDVVDSLILYVSEIPDLSKKKIVFTHHNPLMYYLMNLNYPLDSPWDILNDYKTLKNKLKEMQPDYFIIPKISHREITWPKKSTNDFQEDAMKVHYDLFWDFINNNKFELIYNNSYYEVFKRPGVIEHD